MCCSYINCTLFSMLTHLSYYNSATVCVVQINLCTTVCTVLGRFYWYCCICLLDIIKLVCNIFTINETRLSTKLCQISCFFFTHCWNIAKECPVICPPLSQTPPSIFLNLKPSHIDVPTALAKSLSVDRQQPSLKGLKWHFKKPIE